MKNIELFQQFGLGQNKASDNTNMRTVLYTRVSTTEQEDNTSLDNQIKTCWGVAKRDGHEVVEEFGGRGESAKLGSARAEYESMLKYVRKKSNRIRFIIFYSYDRFSREGGRAIVTKEELRSQGIIIKSATLPIDTSTPVGSAMEDFQLLMSKMDNDNRREKCTTGTKNTLLRGKWCGHAPFGYQWDKNLGVMVIHPVKGPLVKKAFMLKYKDPNISSEEIRRRIKALGHHIPKNTMSRMLRNPLYCGMLAHGLLQGQVVKGLHEAIISPKVFLTVNNVMAEKNTHGWQVNEENNQLPLKNFMHCETCGTPFTGYIAKRKGGKERKNHIPYYKCRAKGCSSNTNANFLGELFQSELANYVVKPELVPLIEKELRVIIAEMSKSTFQEAETMKKRVKEIDTRINRLRERYVVLEEISRTDYEEFGLRLNKEKDEILLELEKSQQNCSTLIDDLGLCVQSAANLAVFWEKGDYKDRQRLQKAVFPEGLYFAKNQPEFEPQGQISFSASAPK